MSVRTVSPSPRTATPFICASRELEENLKYNEIVATFFSCRCSKSATSGTGCISGRVSPNDDLIKVEFEGRRYNVIVSGRGTYYLKAEKKDNGSCRLFLVKDPRSSTPGCCAQSLLPIMAY